MTSGFKLFCAAVIALVLAGCIAAPIELTAQTESRLKAQAPVRFLLTFDDGPSASSFWNPSAKVLDSLKDNPPHIRNIKKYLLAALYNAPLTIENYYAAQINHDLYGRNRGDVNWK